MFDQETIFADDPVEMAVYWASQGAERLHVVDLDGAKTGQPQHTGIIERIIRALEIPVQVGGGIRTLEAADAMLHIGADRIVIGTSAVLDRETAKAMFASYGEQVVLSLDARNERLAIHGWQEIVGQKAIDFAQEMEALGARRIIHTDIGRDGMLVGVNIETMERMVKAVDIPVIASGGVTTIDDIHRLKRLEPYGLEGVITGKALYTGSLDLGEAMAVAHG
jgi:phosphoribosylformimino-5-aminoimidazole carboxamide ribotide isomerase